MKTDLPAGEGGAPVRSSFLPFARPSIGRDEIDEVVETLKSGWLTVGPRTREFETKVARYVGVRSAAALHSCTAGLHLGMVAMGVGPGDEVILPALNFASGPNTVVHLGATPVLVDVDPRTLNVTPDGIASAITGKTKLIMPVHFAGRPCDMDAIGDLAKTRGLGVLADAAHAMGAERRGRKVGSEVGATSFSFYVTKGITTGEGGVLTSRDDDLVDRVALLSLHGMSSGAWKRYTERGSWYYEILEPGYKYNMNDIQAAIGLRQMDRVDDFRNRREEIAEIYLRELGALDAVELPAPFEDGRHAWHLYPIRVDTSALTIGRDEFIQRMREEGIGTSVHFIPIHYHPYYRERLTYETGAFPVTEAYYERAVSLPVYPSMSDDDAVDVTRAVRKIATHYKR